MTTVNDQNTNQDADLVQDELTVLKERAALMGIKHHPAISLDKLREKVNTAVTSDGVAEDDEPVNVAPVAEVVESLRDRRARKMKEATRLVRVIVSCRNPAKKEWEGELFTVGNSSIGTHSKFVPFNNDEGYHVPHVILEQLQQRQCQIFVQGKDARGNKVRVGKLINEFNIEFLDALTVDELTDLAQRQAMANGTFA